MLNGYKRHGEHFRVFPLNNWTEADVWEYIQWRGLDVPGLYFAHERLVVERGGTLVAITPFVAIGEDEARVVRRVRFRTVGDATCTGAIPSEAATVQDILDEVRGFSRSERSTRLDDQRSEAAMEDRKRQGYF